jgi:hypothetical protein
MTLVEMSGVLLTPRTRSELVCMVSSREGKGGMARGVMVVWMCTGIRSELVCCDDD